MHLPPPNRLLALLLIAWLALLGCDPSDPLAAIRAQQQAGAFQESIEPLRNRLADSPDDAEANYLYGRALSMTGRPSLAVWSLRKAMQDPQWLVPAGLLLANGALGVHNYPSAFEAVDRVLEAEPDNVDALMMRANGYAHSKTHYEQALADADRIFELDPDHIDAYEPRILSLLALDRIEEAGEAIEALGRRMEEAELSANQRAWHCATAATFQDDSFEFARAEEQWTECLERFPSSPQVVWDALKFYDKRGQRDRSIELLRAAVTDAPTVHDYRSTLAARLHHAGEDAEAESLLREGTMLDDPSIQAAAWIDLARHHQRVGEHAEAVQDFERALALANDLGDSSPQLQLEYADALLFAEQFEQALAVADEMTLAGYREMIRARVAQERGQPAKALAHYDEAFRLWPSNPWAHYNAAVAAEALGDFDRAAEEYRNTIRIDVAATDARTQIGRMLLAEGRPRVALQLLLLGLSDASLDLPGELLVLRAYASIGEAANWQRRLAQIQRTHPGALGSAVAALARAIRERDGATAAIGVLRATPNLDLESPRHADALRALVELSHELGTSGETTSTVQRALEAHPEASVLHEIHGYAIELRGGAGASGPASRAYERALELNPENARALAGLGRLESAGERDQAVALFDRAAAADPTDPSPMMAAARLVVAGNQLQAAEERLTALLLEHPYEFEAALLLARLRLERGDSSPRTVELAGRAARFGGGAEALALLGRVYTERGESELAEAVAARAAALDDNAAAQRE